MNQKAKELGLNNTHFESPHGLDSDNHYTTAYELAILSDYALQNKTFFNIVGTKSYTVTINGYPKILSNTNELLGNLLGVYGIKTGFTNGANRCLVTACKRDDMDIICVVLGCDTKKFRTQDSIKLIEYTFKNFEYINIFEKINEQFEKWKLENIENFTIYKGISNDLELKHSDIQTPIIPIKKDEIKLININIYSNNYWNAPIKENTVIGKIAVTVNNNEVISLDILNNNTIENKSFAVYILEVLRNYSSILNSISSFL
jgi:D-alanyl-D-alanine carboxypeptidase (penicillin-binding protein 5/6)